MSPEEHINSLLKFLLLPAEPGITDPPPIPLALDGLSPAVYLHAALLYIQQYAFDREFYKYTRKTRARYACTADPEQKEKARAYLEACITVDRSALAPLRTSYDAAHEQQEFIRKIIFPQRWALEELASEMLALVEFVRSEARTASAVKTPMDTGLARNTTVVDQVRLRDVKCRLTGVARLKTGNTAVQKSELAVKKLQVVHGLPFQMGDGVRHPIFLSFLCSDFVRISHLHLSRRSQVSTAMAG
ncbi:hypothetical protein K438DRAFT_721375 [Mycena galopus ATCC 62051]|nr:hypothetical protein K438DRAFT_721375 [Mycena galopus ATCC 62051]